MPRTCEAGEPALYQYQSVKFFQFKVPPGTSLVLTADPWSFLQTWLEQGCKTKRGTNRECRVRALYFSKLAQDFYEAASTTKFPIKGTLCYYGMLNLVKTFLSTNGVELEKQYEHHGLSLPNGSSEIVRVTKPSAANLSIFGEFARLLDKPVTADSDLPIEDIISNIPELHEMAHTLGVLKHSRRKFLPVEILFLVNQTKDRMFTEIRFQKKNEIRVDTTRFLKGAREAYFMQLADDDGWVTFRSKSRKKFTQKNLPTIYRNIQIDYEAFDLCSILNRTGYKFYCDLRPHGFHHLCYHIALLFYIGSIARYRPFEAESVRHKPLSPLINEALAALPAQFLYQMVSLITNRVCVVPQSKID